MSGSRNFPFINTVKNSRTGRETLFRQRATWIEKRSIDLLKIDLSRLDHYTNDLYIFFLGERGMILMRYTVSKSSNVWKDFDRKFDIILFWILHQVIISISNRITRF